MLILTVENIQGRTIVETIGLVEGSTVQAKNIGKDIGAYFKNIVGGEVASYNDMLVQAREIAIERMKKSAEEKGANAIIGVRLMSSSIIEGAAELVAYGTAVIVEDL
ncbi:TPA: heavy metal-binding domain-containing protein [Clostridium perfringens]|uniref:UPF0145 protein CP4_3456 n=1 Tax=Clostridium perfringens TaxID=1502 RepID=F8UNI6_CLOPF|nr:MULTISPECIES: heavy metal-binding domain-containing protein [Clostridium]AEJ34194.1 conserved hypothetical protein [Clostridium perfringens]AEP95043.1 hypothetical protein pNetB_00067 [Clostridium perfringens]AFV15072.1 hypothetical protein pNetB-NE10_66 [Clostridium perfringens]AQW28393.1 hypothetical protein BXT94_16785 [Clostridium perfringens]AWS27148.1 hypothetical protein CYK96_16115 [Clostridium perfringens]